MDKKSNDRERFYSHGKNLVAQVLADGTPPSFLSVTNEQMDTYPPHCREKKAIERQEKVAREEYPISFYVFENPHSLLEEQREEWVYAGQYCSSHENRDIIFQVHPFADPKQDHTFLVTTEDNVEVETLNIRDSKKGIIVWIGKKRPI